MVTAIAREEGATLTRASRLLQKRQSAAPRGGRRNRPAEPPSQPSPATERGGRGRVLPRRARGSEKKGEAPVLFSRLSPRERPHATFLRAGEGNRCLTETAKRPGESGAFKEGVADDVAIVCARCIRPHPRVTALAKRARAAPRTLSRWARGRKGGRQEKMAEPPSDLPRNGTRGKEKGPLPEGDGKAIGRRDYRFQGRPEIWVTLVW